MASYEYSDQLRGSTMGSPVTSTQDHTFKGELRRAGKFTEKSQRILEVGFGNGAFLKWARNEGHRVVGVERSRELCELAREAGFEVHSAIEDLIGCESFDLVVMLDVIEHLDKEEVRKLLSNLSILLTGDGKIIMRFPNGSSPMSLHLFNGDLTHKTLWNMQSLTEILHGSDLKLESYRNAFVPFRGNGIGPAVKRLLTRIVRRVVGFVLSQSFFARPVPMDSNAVAILRKSKSF